MLLQVARAGEVVCVRVGLQNPIDLELMVLQRTSSRGLPDTVLVHPDLKLWSSTGSMIAALLAAGSQTTYVTVHVAGSNKAWFEVRVFGGAPRASLIDILTYII